MSHENPSSIVPGSMHVNRAGERVFIECVKLQSPWTDPRKDPVHGVCEKDRNLRPYQLSGQYFEGKQSEFDLIREYKESEMYEGYLVIWSDGSRDVRFSLETARNVARDYSNQGRLTWKIIKLTGTEDDDTVSSSDFIALDHEQCK